MKKIIAVTLLIAVIAALTGCATDTKLRKLRQGTYDKSNYDYDIAVYQ